MAQKDFLEFLASCPLVKQWIHEKYLVSGRCSQCGKTDKKVPHWGLLSHAYQPVNAKRADAAMRECPGWDRDHLHV